MASSERSDPTNEREAPDATAVEERVGALRERYDEFRGRL